MGLRWFICPDGERTEVEDCLAVGGCRMGHRCATLPYLRLVGYDREWGGVSPSAAGNGPLYMYLRATTDYAADPQDRAFAALGTSVHGKLGMERYTHNVLSEERLTDEDMVGFADVLEEDEFGDGYVLTDYKTWGSYKVSKGIGITQRSVPVLDDSGNETRYKSGQKKGQVKTRKESYIDTDTIDLFSEELQLNRYRIFFESYGFKVSRMQIQAIVRDGGTYVAEGRGVDKNVYLIPIKRLDDDYVLDFYAKLQAEVDEAFRTGTCRKCNSRECWDGRKCESYCEVADACQKMLDKTK